MAMGSIRWSCLFLLFMTTISFQVSGAVDSCTSEGPVLSGKDGQPIWLNTKALIKRAIHCVAPRMPPLAHQARLEGQVLVDILVDEKGKVACARLINGHPMLMASAIDAAKDWTFRRTKQKGKEVSFYGHLVFLFSTGPTLRSEDPCTLAHW